MATIPEVFIRVKIDGNVYESNAVTMALVPPVIPPPPLPPPSGERKYVMINCINWNLEALKTLPLSDGTEFTYFVLPVSSTGVLQGGSDSLEKAFVSKVRTAGKKVTFSIAGGAQDIPAITTAVTKYRTALITSIVTHLTYYAYDGVTLDIENTNITPEAMVAFVNALRVRLDSIKPGLIIGCYTQPWQLTTVWSQVEQVAASLTWISPMLYDAGLYNKTQFTSLTNAWVPKVGKEKLLCGIAVNYPPTDGGLDSLQFGEMLDVVNAQGWRGIGLWQNAIFTEPFKVVQRIKFPSLG